MKLNFNKIILTILTFSTLFLGCKETELKEIEASFARSFAVSGLKVVISGKVNAIFSWEKIKNTKSYTIEIFQTADYSGTPSRVITDISNTLLSYTVTGLNGDTQYYARMKSVGTNGAADSQWVNISFKTEPEQIFQDITSDKLTPNSVTLNWPAASSVTTVKVMPGDITKTLTATEISAGQTTITGLSPLTTYTATILNNTAVRGTKNFTTLPNLPTGADVVYVTATDDLAAKIQAATASTRFVVLQGTKYNSDLTVVLPAGLDISIIGEAGPVKPIISFSLITLPTTGGKLHFENVDITGYANGDATTSKRQYLINQSTTSTMEQVSFENCTIRNLVNTALRLQGTNPITINKVIVNKCTIEDISNNGSNGAYAFINTNVATGKINNITLTNNTFSNIGYGLILHNLAPSVTVAVENNTFYNIVGDARYLIDYNAQIVSSSYTFKNNIIAKSYSPANTSRGLRGGTTATLENNYQASDVIFSSNAIPGINAYTGTSTTLFTAPATGNFKIKDDTFAGKSSAGDPRWRL
ncbi:DUF5123 domain-containing protein [Pedobacter sp.]